MAVRPELDAVEPSRILHQRFGLDGPSAQVSERAVEQFLRHVSYGGCCTTPILIGDGIPFFEKIENDIALHLAEVNAYKNGMVALRYEVRGRGGESPNAT